MMTALMLAKICGRVRGDGTVQEFRRLTSAFSTQEANTNCLRRRLSNPHAKKTTERVEAPTPSSFIRYIRSLLVSKSGNCSCHELAGTTYCALITLKEQEAGMSSAGNHSHGHWGQSVPPFSSSVFHEGELPSRNTKIGRASCRERV